MQNQVCKGFNFVKDFAKGIFISLFPATHSFMLLKDKIYLHELREQFLLKVVDEWPSKWQKEFDEFSSFEALKSKNAFLEALLVDIEAVLHRQLNGEAKNELFSKDFLRRFIFEYGTKEVRIQTRSRNVISVYLGYADWDDFQQKNNDLDRQNIHINYVNIEESLLPALRKMQVIPLLDEPYTTFQAVKPRFSVSRFVYGFFGLIALSVLCYFSFDWWQNRPFSSQELKEVEFKVIKTVGQYPQAARIFYDVSSLPRVQKVEVELGVGQVFNAQKVKAFFTDSEKLIDTVAQTYFYPGIYRLVLKVNGQAIKTHHHVVYSKPSTWSSWGYGLAYEKAWATNISTTKDYIDNGVLHFDPQAFPNEIKGEFDYRQALHALTQDFGVSFDSLTIEARLKNPENEGGESCYDMEINAFDKNFNALAVKIVQEGCTDFAQLTVGASVFRRQTPHAGKNVDLDRFGINHNEWNVLKIKTLGSEFWVFVNDKEAYQGHFKTKDPSTELVDLRFLFKGAGSIDWVKVSNSYTGKVVYQTDF